MLLVPVGRVAVATAVAMDAAVVVVVVIEDELVESKVLLLLSMAAVPLLSETLRPWRPFLVLTSVPVRLVAMMLGEERFELAGS